MTEAEDVERVDALADCKESFNWYSKHAKEARLGDRSSDIALLVFGALIPTTALLDYPVARVVTVVLGVCVVITTGLRRVFNWRESWIRFTGACVQLATARIHYKYKVDAYNVEDQAERDRLLMAKVREIEEKESKSWMVASASHSAEKEPQP